LARDGGCSDVWLLRRALPTQFLFEDGGEAAVAMVVQWCGDELQRK